DHTDGEVDKIAAIAGLLAEGDAPLVSASACVMGMDAECGVAVVCKRLDFLIDSVLRCHRLLSECLVALDASGLGEPHVVLDGVACLSAGGSPNADVATEVAVPCVDERVPIQGLVLVAGGGRVHTEPINLVGREGRA